MGPLVTKILRFCFSWIDSIVVKLISYIYKLLMDLAELVLYSDEVIETVGKRIALLLGIFMLFKLATSIISYIVSPDKFNDSQKGGSKLITNVVISLSLLVSINLIFKEAYNIQKTIVESQIIEKIFFGNMASEVKNYSSNNNTSGSSKMDIGYYLYTGLFAPNNEVFGDACDDLWDISMDVTTACEQKLIDIVGDGGLRTIYKSRNTLDMSYVFIDYDLMLATSTVNSKVFAFDYWPIISSVAGVLVLLVLISFSMDIATRAIKLLFLQIIAPIPIISYMDVGKGHEIFQKWGKECINTYLTVFIRLIAINFAVFMIILVRGNWKDVFTHNVWMNIFIIVGCLMFAKQVPKLLEDFLGIKMDGMAINPLKKFQEQALFGKQITGLAGAGLAGGAAFGSNVLSNIYNNQNRKGLLGAGATVFTALGSGIAGGVSAAARGTVGAFKGQKFGQVYSSAYRGAINARNNRDTRRALGINGLDILANNIHRGFGVDTIAESQDANIKLYDEFASSGEAVVSISESEVQKYANKIKLDNSTGIGQLDLTDTNPDAAILSAAGITSSTFDTLGQLREAMSDTRRYNAKTRAALNSEYERIKSQAEALYRSYATGGSADLHASTEFSFIDEKDVNGQTAMAHITNVNDIFGKNKDNEVFVKNGVTSITGSNVKDVTKKVKFESTSIKSSGAYRQAHKVQEQTNREKK